MGYSVAFVFWTSAFFCFVARYSKASSCSIKLNRNVCALPFDYVQPQENALTDCTIGIFLTVKPNSLQRCTRLATDLIKATHENNTEDAIAMNKSEIFSESPQIHCVNLTVLGKNLLRKLGMILPGKVTFSFHASYNYANCDFNAKCISANSLAVDFVLDRAPIVVFKMLDDTAVDQSTSVVGNKTLLWIKNINSSVALEVHVKDEDVYNLAAEAFEYSAINEQDVDFKVSVSFINQYEQYDNVAMTKPYRRNVGVMKVDCNNSSDICKKKFQRINYGYSIVHLNFSVTAICEEINNQHNKSRSYDSSFDSCLNERVKLTLNFTVTSGLTNRQKGLGTLILRLRQVEEPSLTTPTALSSTLLTTAVERTNYEFSVSV
jgi:hypothetical protein